MSNAGPSTCALRDVSVSVIECERDKKKRHTGYSVTHLLTQPRNDHHFGVRLVNWRAQEQLWQRQHNSDIG